MEDDVTLHDLMQNPAGRNTRHVGARYMIRDAITAKFREALSVPHRRRRFGAAVYRHGEAYLVWVKVPSEKYDVVFDVVFRLTFKDGTRAVTASSVQLYCNSPGWVFTVGYVAATRGLLIPGWERALGRAATEAPSTTNAKLDYGHDKVTFQAMLFMTGPAGLVTRADLDRAAAAGPGPDPKDPKLSAEAKLFEYERARDKAVAANRLARAANRAQKEEEARLKKADARRASGAAKVAKAAKAVKAVKARRSVGSAVRKKVAP